MGKKKFIDKKKAATFELCPRDTSDPLYSDAPGGDKIFLRVDQNPVNINGFAEDNSQFDDAPEEGEGEEKDLAYGYSSFAGSSTSNNNPLPAHVRKEILELGYPDDGYNYLDHLREIKNTGGGSNFYANPKFEGEYLPRDVKAYDASRVKVSGVVVDGGEGEDGDKLMYSVASKTVNVKVVKKAIDPEVAALLEDSDGSEFGSDVEDLEEDFVVKAQEGEGEGECSGVSNEEVVVELAENNNQRVPRQIDELFDQLELNEYGSESDDDNDAYMSGDGEEEFLTAQSVGDNLIYEKPKDYELDDEKYMNPADLLKNSESLKDKEELEYIIRRSVQLGENLVNSNEDEFVEVVEESSDESEKWDCETIVTTYSNLDNHPGRICDPERARKKLSEALAKAKSVNGGSRIITLQGKEKLPVEFLPGRARAEQTVSVKPKAEPVKRKSHGQETKEEKKERKAGVKIEKREARKMKKETKELYRFETQRAQKAVAVSGPSSIPL